MKKKLVVYGTGQTSEVISQLIKRHNEVEIVGYCDESEQSDQKFLGKPVTPLNRVIDVFDPAKHIFFVAIGYREGNKIRQKYIKKVKSLGFQLYSLIASSVDTSCELGENVVITGSNFIQPYSTVELGTFVWGGCVIGHHSRLGECSWVSPSVNIGGNSKIGACCFLGMGTIINQFISVGSAVSWEVSHYK